jgi:Domain of unknown function (DUF4249)
MKNIIQYLALILFTISFSSCEDVVDVDLNTAAPRLVIDASIKWQKGTSGNEQKIKLTTTTDYFSNVIPAVSGATVFITDSSNTVFDFIETPSTGEYICSNFTPVINETYTLTVQVLGNTYTATQKLLATPVIESIEQTTVDGFAGEEIQIKFFYQDNGLEDNFYLIGFKNSSKTFPEYGVIEDEFFQGNEMFGLYRNEDLKTDDELFMSLQGVDERYFNYMNKLITIAGSSGGSPFATPPATLRGNIVNQTDQKNYPLGYFHLSEIDSRNYTIE